MKKRRGFLMLETLAAGALLVTLLLLCLQAARAGGYRLQAARQRQAATEEAANQLEHAAAWSWEQLTAADRPSLEPTPEAKRLLPDVRVQIKLDQPADAPEARRLTAAVHWIDRAGMPQSIQLTTWKYRGAAAMAAPLETFLKELGTDQTSPAVTGPDETPEDSEPSPFGDTEAKP